MSRWFRLDDDVINDPKILLLPEAMRWIWIAFLCIASKNAGKLPAIDIVALSLRVKTTKAAEYITRLVAAGLIDKTEIGFAPHNWNARQFKSDVSTERVKRFRKHERNVPETPPHTETHTQTEKKDYCPVAKATRTREKYSEEFEQQFWKPYPRTPIMSKQEAWREWMKLAPDDRLASCQALPAYIRHLAQNPTLQAVHACRFLSQRRAEGILEIAAEKPVFDVRKHLVS